MKTPTFDIKNRHTGALIFSCDYPADNNDTALVSMTIQQAVLDAIKNGVDFTSADLTEVNFTRGRRTEIHNAKFHDATFSPNHLTYANFKNCDLSEAVFSDGPLFGVNFLHCNLRQAVFKDLRMRSVDIAYTDLTDSTFESVEMWMVDFSFVKLSYGLFKKTNFHPGVNFHQTQFDCVHFLHCNMKQTKFNLGMFDSVSVHSSTIIKCQWWSSPLIGTDFTSCILSETVFNRSHADCVRFTNTRLRPNSQLKDPIDQLPLVIRDGNGFESMGSTELDRTINAFTTDKGVLYSTMEGFYLTKDEMLDHVTKHHNHPSKKAIAQITAAMDYLQFHLTVQENEC